MSPIAQFFGIGKPVVVASHPRSGTHLTIDLLRKQFPACATHKLPAQPLDRLYFALEALSAPSHQSITEAKALKILKKAQRPLVKTHADPSFGHLNGQFSQWQSWLNQDATILYIFRDGRATMCSFHLFMQSYDPSARCSLSEFMRQTIDGQSRVKRWVNHVEQWLAHPNVHPVQFEDIICRTAETIDKLACVLGVEAKHVEPLLPQSIRSLWHGRWVRLTSIAPESTAIIGYYRGQKSAKWKTAFSSSDHVFFESEAGNLLRRLGYPLIEPQ